MVVLLPLLRKIKPRLRRAIGVAIMALGALAVALSAAGEANLVGDGILTMVVGWVLIASVIRERRQVSRAGR